MKGLIWGIAIVLAAIWSLVAWAGHGLIGFAGRLLADNADLAPVDPEGVVLISEWTDVLAGFGQGTVAVIWGIGLLLIVGLAALAAKIAAPSRQPAPPAYGGRPDDYRGGPVVDHRADEARPAAPPRGRPDLLAEARRLSERGDRQR